MLCSTDCPIRLFSRLWLEQRLSITPHHPCYTLSFTFQLLLRNLHQVRNANPDPSQCQIPQETKSRRSVSRRSSWSGRCTSGIQTTVISSRVLRRVAWMVSRNESQLVSVRDCEHYHKWLLITVVSRYTALTDAWLHHTFPFRRVYSSWIPTIHRRVKTRWSEGSDSCSKAGASRRRRRRRKMGPE